MTEIISDFIRALRAADVRVSTSESIDAGEVLSLVGFHSREVMRHALRAALAKSEDEERAFNETFDRFFTFEPFAEKAPSPSEATLEKQESANGEQDGSASMPGAPGSGGERAPASNLAEMLERGDQAALQMALAEAARRVELNRIRLFTQRGRYTREIMEEMGLDDLNALIDTGERQGGEPARRAEKLTEARTQLREQVRDYVEKQLEIFTRNSGRQLREEILSRMRLTNVDRSDAKILRELVRKMAKRLTALHSRRKKVDRRGQLDVRRTIRANIEYEGLMFHTVWKRRKIDRPKVMAVCDVSGSVAQVARFLLMFLYSLQEVLPNVRSFVFSNRLGEVTDDFKVLEIDAAIMLALRDYGGGSTDYGRAMTDFEALAIDDIDHRTTVLILGDGRSNYGDPRADILKKIHARAKRVIWLNPETRSLWGTGDSEMKRLAPYCDKAVTCASVSDLERVVSDLLRSAV
jgi:uncharacterized protein with von Willebrand factor type A (vWA) domain